MRGLLRSLLVLAVGGSLLAAGRRGLEPDGERLCEGVYGRRLSDGGHDTYVFLEDGGIARCVSPDAGPSGRER